MNNYEKILNSIKKGEMIHLLMINATPEELLNADIDTMAEIINRRCEKKPCNYYCHNCGRCGVELTECHNKIKEWLQE